MNKRKVDLLIQDAHRILAEVVKQDGKETIKIVNNNKIASKWRGQISAFGAAVSTGSLSSAVAFFSSKGSSEVSRELIIQAIEKMLTLGEEKVLILDGERLFSYIKRMGENIAKEEIINAAIALKLAMNLYEIEKKDGN